MVVHNENDDREWLLMHTEATDVTASFRVWKKNAEVDIWLTWQPYWSKAIFCEFVATFLFIYTGMMSVASGVDGRWDQGAHIILVALSTGFAVVALVYAFGPISGCHMNPAVTFAVMIVGDVEIVRGLCYMVAQVSGSTLACFLVEFSGRTPGWAEFAAINTSSMTFGQTFIVEVVFSILFLLVIFGVAVDPREEAKSVAPLAIGVMLASIILAGGTTTCSLNPARSLGPSFASGFYHRNLLATVIGPFVGSGMGAALYNLVWLEPDAAVPDKDCNVVCVTDGVNTEVVSKGSSKTNGRKPAPRSPVRNKRHDLDDHVGHQRDNGRGVGGKGLEYQPRIGSAQNGRTRSEIEHESLPAPHFDEARICLFEGRDMGGDLVSEERLLALKVVIKYANQSCSTAVVKRDANPVWELQTRFHVDTAADPVLLFSVYQKDAFLGLAKYSLRGMQSGGRVKKWCNVKSPSGEKVGQLKIGIVLMNKIGALDVTLNDMDDSSSLEMLSSEPS